MAWGTATAADYLSGEGAKTGAVEFYNRDLELTEIATGWGWEAEATTTSATWATMSTRTIMLPEWFLTGAEIKLRFRCWEAVGATTASARLTETGTPRSGSTTNMGTLGTASGPAAATFTVTGLTAPDDTWAGTIKTFDLEMQRDSGTGTVVLNLEALAMDIQFVGV